MDYIKESIEFAARGIEALAVAIMVGFILLGTWRWLLNSVQRIKQSYGIYRILLARTLQVGLELLVAADIIRTVALETTLESIAELAALVVIRTIIGWTLAVEVEGHWPWQTPTDADSDPGTLSRG